MLNIYFFNKISKIEELFKENIFNKNIKIEGENSQYKSSSSSSVKIDFFKKDNTEYKYSLEIYSHDYIEVTIPLNSSNYKYKTILYDIDTTLEYLNFHVSR